MTLQDKIVLVTGCGGGIGSAVCRLARVPIDDGLTAKAQ